MGGVQGVLAGRKCDAAAGHHAADQRLTKPLDELGEDLGVGATGCVFAKARVMAARDGEQSTAHAQQHYPCVPQGLRHPGRAGTCTSDESLVWGFLVWMTNA